MSIYLFNYPHVTAMEECSPTTPKGCCRSTSIEIRPIPWLLLPCSKSPPTVRTSLVSVFLTIIQYKPLFTSVRTARGVYSSIRMQVFRIRTSHQVIRAVDLAVYHGRYSHHLLKRHQTISHLLTRQLPQRPPG